MENVRVAQIGQTAINKPLFEVLYRGKRYAFGVGDSGRMVFRSPTYLRQLGVYTAVASEFEQSPEGVRNVLRLGGDSSTMRDDRFPALALGNGLAFVEAWSNVMGWKSHNPIVYLTLTV